MLTTINIYQLMGSACEDLRRVNNVAIGKEREEQLS